MCPKRYTLFMLFLFLGSCTITKRQHLGGYYVEWHLKRQYQNFTTHDTVTCTGNSIQVIHSLATQKQLMDELNDTLAQHVFLNDTTFIENEIQRNKCLNHLLEPKTISASYVKINSRVNSPSDAGFNDVKPKWWEMLLGIISLLLFPPVLYSVSNQSLIKKMLVYLIWIGVVFLACWFIPISWILFISFLLFNIVFGLLLIIASGV